MLAWVTNVRADRFHKGSIQILAQGTIHKKLATNTPYVYKLRYIGDYACLFNVL